MRSHEEIQLVRWKEKSLLSIIGRFKISSPEPRNAESAGDNECSKAPQYPWPCALQDVLAACTLPSMSFLSCLTTAAFGNIVIDLYLTQPPHDALHAAIPAAKIVLAGDSAGAGLCVTLLTVIRDMGLSMPAGAVLISPWVDLTHSFPSVMKNTETVRHCLCLPLG